MRYITAFAALASSSLIANIVGVVLITTFVIYDFKLLGSSS